MGNLISNIFYFIKKLCLFYIDYHITSIYDMKTSKNIIEIDSKSNNFSDW